MSDAFVVVTPEQAVTLQAELDAVVARYRRVGQGNPSARRVAVYTIRYPLDLDRPPSLPTPRTGSS